MSDIPDGHDICAALPPPYPLPAGALKSEMFADAHPADEKLLEFEYVSKSS
jgi:hypothetical protein